jgi:hypothetical protein
MAGSARPTSDSWAFAPPVNHEKSGAGVLARQRSACPRLLVAQAFSLCLHQQDAGATKNVGRVLRAGHGGHRPP